MTEKTRKTTSGRTYNGVEYTRTIEEWGIEIGGKMRMRRMTTTDYTKDGVTARVIDHGTRGSLYGDRQNAEMFQIEPIVGRTRTYSNVDNAHAKAIALVLAGK